jgi:hypothetical protein
LITAVFDTVSEGSGKACWVLMRRARAGTFKSASGIAKAAPFQAVTPPENQKSGQVLVRTSERKKASDSNRGNRLCQEF